MKVTPIKTSEAYIYWVRSPEMTDPMSEGYIGITNNYERRFSEHKSRGYDTYFGNVIKSKGWESLTKSVIDRGTLDDMLKVELNLRPEEHIGWNLTKGGGYPPKCTTKTAKAIHESKIKSGFYKSENFKIQCKLGSNTKRKNGFYDFSESQKRSLKGAKTRSESGYYETEEFKEARRKAVRTLKETGYYTTPEFSSNHSKTVDSRKLNNKVYQRSVCSLSMDNLPIKRFNSFYDASEFYNMETYLINEVLRGKRGSTKGKKWALYSDLSEEQLLSLADDK